MRFKDFLLDKNNLNESKFFGSDYGLFVRLNVGNKSQDFDNLHAKDLSFLYDKTKDKILVKIKSLKEVFKIETNDVFILDKKRRKSKNFHFTEKEKVVKELNSIFRSVMDEYTNDEGKIYRHIAIEINIGGKVFGDFKSNSITFEVYANNVDIELDGLKKGDSLVDIYVGANS